MQSAVEGAGGLCLTHLLSMSTRVCVHAQWCLRHASSVPQAPLSLLCPWNFPGKNTTVGCHFLLTSQYYIARNLITVKNLLIPAQAFSDL